MSDKKNTRKKSFWAKLVKKLDNKLKEKAEDRSCCNTKDKNKGESCCSK